MTQRGKVGLLPAAFNPPTIAHVGLAEAAQAQLRLDEIVFVLPRVLPHKELGQAAFRQRLALLEAAVAGRSGWRAGTSRGGLFLEIAREFRPQYGPGCALYLLCGADACRRIVCWDYGDAPTIVEQLEEFEMAVAARRDEYEPPSELAHRIHSIRLDEELQQISSSQVREAIAAGRPWRRLVPEAVGRIIEEQGLYR